MKRKNIKTKGHTKRDMNDNTYKLRRKVMDCIYDAKKVVDLPRINVIITDHENEKVLGTARMRDNIIWIPAKTLDYKDNIIRHVVFHEICHAVFGTNHDDNCPLMSTFLENDVTPSVQDKMLKKHKESCPYKIDLTSEKVERKPKARKPRR